MRNGVVDIGGMPAMLAHQGIPSYDREIATRRLPMSISSPHTHTHTHTQT